LPAGWSFDLNLQFQEWPMTETFARAEMIRGFMGIDPFKMARFGATESIFLEISVDNTEFYRKINP
jgi:hypothetical protein